MYASFMLVAYGEWRDDSLGRSCREMIVWRGGATQNPEGDEGQRVPCQEMYRRKDKFSQVAVLIQDTASTENHQDSNRSGNVQDDIVLRDVTVHPGRSFPQQTFLHRVGNARLGSGFELCCVCVTGGGKKPE
jgi:hypothetical protein